MNLKIAIVYNTGISSKLLANISILEATGRIAGSSNSDTKWLIFKKNILYIQE